MFRSIGRWRGLERSSSQAAARIGEFEAGLTVDLEGSARLSAHPFAIDIALLNEEGFVFQLCEELAAVPRPGQEASEAPQLTSGRLPMV